MSTNQPKGIPTVADQAAATQPKPIVPDGMASYPSWRYHESGKSEIVQNPDRDAALAAEGGWADTPPPKKVVEPAPKADVVDNTSVSKQLAAMSKRIDDLTTRLADLDAVVNEMMGDSTKPAESKKSK